jgi:hypothetical protein
MEVPAMLGRAGKMKAIRESILHQEAEPRFTGEVAGVSERHVRLAEPIRPIFLSHIAKIGLLEITLGRETGLLLNIIL